MRGAAEDPSAGAAEHLLRSSLQTNLFLRLITLAKLSALKYAALPPEASEPELHKQDLIRQVSSIARELGEMKGCAMKVAQIISVYGEHFLPPEANSILKTLQSEAPRFNWSPLRESVNLELGAARLGELEIEEHALASASLGQVHVAKVIATGERLALKIQFPGIERAVSSDLKALRMTLMLARAAGMVQNFDSVLHEIQSMLAQELDYSLEADQIETFARRLADDERFLVPRVHRRFSSRLVLATSLIEGVRVDSLEVRALPQERRDRLGSSILDLCFREIFEFGAVQTDPHFGNFQVLLGSDGLDRLALFDFGAVREFSPEFLESYRALTRASLDRSRHGVIQAAQKLGFLQTDDPQDLQFKFSEFCFLMTEPFAEQDGSYDWKSSDLPRRLARKLGEVLGSYRLRPPPREMIFLDRKTTGVFTALSVIGARFNGRRLLEARLNP